jgi:hydroxyethylthiazole kinase-like sugar kinase family protein
MNCSAGQPLALEVANSVAQVICANVLKAHRLVPLIAFVKDC